MSVIITTDSTADLGECAAKRNVEIQPLTVLLGENSYLDGVNVTPQDIFNHVKLTGQLPKTSAPSIGDYEDFFRPLVEDGDTVIHINISAKSSSSYLHAVAAAEQFEGKVFVVDSKALSTGQGLLVMKACDLRDAGVPAEIIVEKLNTLRPFVNTSFVPDRLDYLFKGGRCSRMQMYGANFLKIHPTIEMSDGQLIPSKKYHGGMDKCVSAYIEALAVRYPDYDKTRCFITHSTAEPELVEVAKKKVAELFEFDEVIETVAGSIVTSHCGKGTLGVLFIAE